MSKPDPLLSHQSHPHHLADQVSRLREAILARGDLPEASADQRLAWLAELTQFELGRFLIQNAGLNGYWTDYILTYPDHGRHTGLSSDGSPLSDLERYLLERAPVLRATQERFRTFLSCNQAAVCNQAALASIPCGRLGELLYLDYSGIETIRLLGIDYDPQALTDAVALAQQEQVSFPLELLQADAWHLPLQDALDLISSNGLTIYEPDDGRVEALYLEFFKALKPGGRLVTSFLTPPSEWRQDQINLDDLARQKMLFTEVLAVKWQCYRTTAQTQAQLARVGFKTIDFLPDSAHLFPTVVAFRP